MIDLTINVLRHAESMRRDATAASRTGRLLEGYLAAISERAVSSRAFSVPIESERRL
jgi:hypothetical protein